MELTVKQIAERLLPIAPGGDMDGLVRQLRHWTLTGVVRPLGTIHTGAGKHRKYEESEVYFAALALELTRWRIPVGVSDLVVQAARKEYFQQDVRPTAKPLNAIKDAIEGRANQFLLLRPGEGLEALSMEIMTGDYKELARSVIERGWTRNTPSFVAINLSALFAKIRS
jgi:hypothetical protein